MLLNLAQAGIDWADDGGQPLQTVEVLFSGPMLTRWNLPAGERLVVDLNQGKVMILLPASKQARVMQIGPPGVVPPLNRFNALMAIKPLIEYAMRAQDESVESLGTRTIEGATAVGYFMAGPAHHGDLTVWADAASGQPISIERHMKHQNQRMVIRDIETGLAWDKSLFSVEPPPDYQVASGDEAEPGFVIQGTVTDAATGQPIPGARVSDNGYGTPPYRGATCDAQGHYEYRTWPEEHSIIAKAPGYKSQQKGLTGLFHAEPGNAVVLDFVLEHE